MDCLLALKFKRCAVKHFEQASPMRCIGAGDALVLAQWTDENGPLDPWACALVPIGSDDGGDDDDDYNGAAATAGTAAAAAAAPAERPTLAAAAACSPFARLLMDDAVGRGATLATLAATVETDEAASAVPLPAASAAAATRDAVPAKRRGGTKRKSARRLEKDAAWRAKAARELAMAKAQRALRAKTPCRYLAMPGGCRNGDACPFSHQQN